MQTAGVAPSAGTTALAPKQDRLGKADFLKLLVAQLKFQDPMKPMEDKEFIAQMAQFNSLEEMQKLNKNLTAQAEFSQLTQASSLIGKSVTLAGEMGEIRGRVTEVRKLNGEIKLLVGGEAFAPSQIVKVGG